MFARNSLIWTEIAAVLFSSELTVTFGFQLCYAKILSIHKQLNVDSLSYVHEANTNFNQKKELWTKLMKLHCKVFACNESNSVVLFIS